MELNEKDVNEADFNEKGNKEIGFSERDVNKIEFSEKDVSEIEFSEKEVDEMEFSEKEVDEMEFSERLFAKELKESFPPTPEHFRITVENAVREQNDTARHTLGHRKRRRLRFLLPAAAVMACGIIALGAPGSPLNRWLRSFGISDENASSLTETEAEITYLTEPSPLRIHDIYIDGTTLIFTAEAAEGVEPAKGNSGLALKDHAEVNGQDSMVGGEFILDQDTGLYTGSLYLPSGLTEDTLTIRIRVYTGDGVQECAFQTANRNATRTVSDQTFAIPDGTVTVSGISLSPSASSFTLTYRFTGENAESRAEACGNYLYHITDSSGTVLDSLASSSEAWVNYVTIQDASEENGAILRKVALEGICGLDPTSAYWEVEPYLPETDEEGRVIPDTGTAQTSDAFTLSLG